MTVQQITELEFLLPMEAWDEGHSVVVPVVSTPHDPTWNHLLEQIAQAWEYLIEHQQFWVESGATLIGGIITRAEHNPGRLPTVYLYDPKFNRWVLRGGDN